MRQDVHIYSERAQVSLCLISALLIGSILYLVVCIYLAVTLVSDSFIAHRKYLTYIEQHIRSTHSRGFNPP